MKRRPRPRPVLRCPKCLSYDINAIPGVFTAPQYVCRKCEYRGMIVLEEDAPLPSEKKSS